MATGLSRSLLGALTVLALLVINTAQAHTLGSVFSDALPKGKQGPQLVVVPAGRYLLGDHSGRGNHNERPLTPIEISQPFAIGRYEVTFSDWQQYAKATATPMPDNEGWGLSAQRPVIHVSLASGRGLQPMALKGHRSALPFAHRSRMGICRPRRQHQLLLVG